MKAATYARYSTENQSDNSIEDQQRECERIAHRAGFEIVASYADRGLSGGTTGRPEYQRMLAAARAGEFDAIIAEDLSRLWRNMAEQAPQLAGLSDLGIAVVTHDIDTRQDSAELLGAVQGAMNSIYRKEISRRTRRGMEGLALAGKSTGGRCYGYGSDAEARTVETIFNLRADGLSLKSIADRLNDLDIPGAKGRRWGPSSIFVIVTNRRYTGAVVYGRQMVRRSAVDSKRSQRVDRNGGPLVSRQDESKRLISDELWARSRS